MSALQNMGRSCQPPSFQFFVTRYTLTVHYITADGNQIEEKTYSFSTDQGGILEKGQETYTVIYQDPDGNELQKAEGLSLGDATPKFTETLSLPKNYKFKGWKLTTGDRDGDQLLTTETIAEKSVDADDATHLQIIYKAVWELIPAATCTIRHKYYLNGNLVGDIPETVYGTVKQYVTKTSAMEKPVYGRNTHTYQEGLSTIPPFYLEESGQGFVLVYTRTTGGCGRGGGTPPEPPDPPSLPSLPSPIR